MSHNIELPESTYQRLLHAAQEAGTTPAAWIATHLPEPGEGNGKKPALSPEEIRLADTKLSRHIVYCDHAVGSDNDAIDADLARAYGADE